MPVCFSANTASATAATTTTVPTGEQALMMLNLIRQMTGTNLVGISYFHLC